ncbi:hypothetical protein GPA10_37835 [Streptomyces sp. p1417]|uniref:WD40-like Beta Propeller Repeat n=1 Tax=Streptomyces typhae TaxID=2681492 RepID=A0A6L6XAS1_9ACTN|nr:hypothetical protein [Streptomyces typhae]MVO90359.1 hypothetical protein [Streptomyces typhae]
MRRRTNWITTRRVRAVLGAAVAVCAVTAVLPGSASAEPAASAEPGARHTATTGIAGHRATSVERVSVANDGTQANDHSTHASITPNGRHIVFASSADNLTSSRGGYMYVRDQRRGHLTRHGQLLGEQHHPPTISNNGEWALYSGYLQHFKQMYLAEVSRSTGSLVRTWGNHQTQPSLDADGRLIAFVVIPKRDWTTSDQRILVMDRATGAEWTITWLSHSLPSRPSISGDNRRVAYQDAKTEDVFIWDWGDDVIGPIEGPSKAAEIVQLSDDGSKVVYRSGSDTHVYELRTSTTQVVPDARGLAIDPTGRYLLYAPQIANRPSLVLRDLRTGTEETVADKPASAGTDAVSAHGRDVVFTSAADDVVPDDTNGKTDVFVRRFH